jgi:hypothetical protein
MLAGAIGVNLDDTDLYYPVLGYAKSGTLDVKY